MPPLVCCGDSDIQQRRHRACSATTSASRWPHVGLHTLSPHVSGNNIGMPVLQVRELMNPGEIFKQCMGMMARLAQLGLVHCDFNEFNLLVRLTDTSLLRSTVLRLILYDLTMVKFMIGNLTVFGLVIYNLTVFRLTICM